MSVCYIFRLNDFQCYCSVLYIIIAFYRNTLGRYSSSLLLLFYGKFYNILCWFLSQHSDWFTDWFQWHVNQSWVFCIQMLGNPIFCIFMYTLFVLLFLKGFFSAHSYWLWILFKQIYLTHRKDPTRYYDSKVEWELEPWHQMQDIPFFGRDTISVF